MGTRELTLYQYTNKNTISNSMSINIQILENIYARRTNIFQLRELNPRPLNTHRPGRQGRTTTATSFGRRQFKIEVLYT